MALSFHSVPMVSSDQQNAGQNTIVNDDKHNTVDNPTSSNIDPLVPMSPIVGDVPDLDDDLGYANAASASFTAIRVVNAASVVKHTAVACPVCPGYLEEKKHPDNHNKNSHGTISVWHCSNMSDAVREYDNKFRLSTEEEWQPCDKVISDPSVKGKPNWIVERAKRRKNLFFLKEAGGGEAKKTRKPERKGVLGTNCKTCLSRVKTDPGLFLLCTECRNLINQSRHKVRLHLS